MIRKHISITESLQEKLKFEVEKTGASESEIIRRALEKYLGGKEC